MLRYARAEDEVIDLTTSESLCSMNTPAPALFASDKRGEGLQNLVYLSSAHTLTANLPRTPTSGPDSSLAARHRIKWSDDDQPSMSWPYRTEQCIIQNAR